MGRCLYQVLLVHASQHKPRLRIVENSGKIHKNFSLAIIVAVNSAKPFNKADLVYRMV